MFSDIPISNGDLHRAVAICCRQVLCGGKKETKSKSSILEVNLCVMGRGEDKTGGWAGARISNAVLCHY